MKEKRNKTGRNPKLDPAVFRYTVRFNEEEHNRFLAMFEKSGVYAKSVFIKAHFFGQPFRVLKVDSPEISPGRSYRKNFLRNVPKKIL